MPLEAAGDAGDMDGVARHGEVDGMPELDLQPAPAPDDDIPLPQDAEGEEIEK